MNQDGQDAQGVFKVMGALLILYTIGFAGVSCVALVRFHQRGHSLEPILGFGAVTLTLFYLGRGLWHIKRWAAVSFSFLTGSCALFLAHEATKGALHPAPGTSANWVGFLFALLMTLPSLLTIRLWKYFL